MTERTLLALYSDITEYARNKANAYGLAPCDVDDIIGEAYCRALKKLPRHRKRGNGLLKTIAWCEVMNILEMRNRHAEVMWRDSVRLDAPIQHNADPDPEDDDTEERENLSDHGRGAEAIISCDDLPEPEWVYLFRAQRQKESGLARKILNRLQYTYSYKAVWSDLGISWRIFGANLAKLREHFDLAFRCYHAHLVNKQDY